MRRQKLEQAIELIERFIRQHEFDLQLKAGERPDSGGFYAELSKEERRYLGASAAGSRTLTGALLALAKEVELEAARLERLRERRVAKLTKAHRLKLARGDYDHDNGL
jgi:hypothetical protein